MGMSVNQPTPYLDPFVMWVTGAVAVALAVGFLLLPPSGTDLTAQLARAAFAREHPLAAVDLRWYAGVHPAAYSVLAAYPAGLLGVRLTAALAMVVASLLLAALLMRWQARRPLLASVWGTAALTGNIVCGRMTFAVGVAAALGSLLAVPRRRRMRPGRSGRRWVRWVPSVLLAALTTLTSPVAAVFLGLVCVVWAVRQRGALAPAAAAGVLLLAIAALFPEPGRMPFAWHVAWPALLACLGVVVLCRSPLVRGATLLYAAGVLAVYLVPGPLGSNVERLAVLFTGPVLLARSRAPRLLLVPVLVVVAWWTVLVPQRDFRATDELARERAAAARLVGILGRLGPVTGRVEVVPMQDHGEASVVAQAWPLARGWERHVDVERASVLYSGELTPQRYRTWLDEQAVEYVALARHRHDWSAARELRLLEDPPAYLERVHQDGEWTVWRVTDARPIVASPARALRITPDRIVLDVPDAESVAIAVHWSPWLTVDGGACLRRAGDHAVVVARGPGVVTLTSSYAGRGPHC
jgi:hypothetical protein